MYNNASSQATSESWKAAYHAARKARGGTAPAATMTQSSGPKASTKDRAERAAINQAATASGTVLEKLKTGQGRILTHSASVSDYTCGVTLIKTGHNFQRVLRELRVEQACTYGFAALRVS